MRRKVLTVILLVLTLALPLLLSGCGDGNTDRTLSLYLPAGSAQWPRFAEKLKARFPDIIFRIGYYTGSDQTDYLNARVIHDDTGDLVFTTTQLTDQVQRERLLDLSGYDFVNRYDPGLLENFVKEDRIYQLPFLISLRCVAYNRTIFEEHGWEEPRSFDELEALVKRIRTEAPELTPVAMSLGGLAYPFTTVTTLAQCEYLSTVDGNRWEEEFLAGNGSVGEGWADGLDMTARLIDAGAFDAEKYVGVWDGNLVRNDFAAGNSAMMILWAGQSELLEVMADPENPYTFGLFPFYGTGRGNKCVGVNLNCCWALNRHLGDKGNEKKLENALKVMEWLSSNEAYEATGVSSAMMPPFRDMGDKVAPEFRNLWQETADGYRAIPVYSGFESIMIECGQIVQDAMLAGSSEGMIRSFIETADTMYRDSLAADMADKVGECGEDIKEAGVVQLIADMLDAYGAGDFALVTTGDVAPNLSANRRGACGVLYKGKLTVNDLQILQSDTRNIQVLSLTGGQVKALLNEGKTTPDNNYQEGLEATWAYTWAGLDVTKNRDKVTGVKLDGRELEDDAMYRVTFLYGDYPVEWKDSVSIEDTGVTEIRVMRTYLDTHEALKSPLTSK